MRGTSKHLRRLALAAGVAVMAATAAACGSAGNGSGSTASSGSAGANAPIKIGFVNTDQGTSGLPEATEGAKAAVAYINAKLGGINGHPITLDYCSVGTDAQTNQECGQHFAASGDALVVTGLMFNGGPLYSAVNSASIPMVGLVPLTPADMTPASKVTYWSAGQLIQRGYTSLLGEVDPSATKVGVLLENNAVGQGSWSIIKDSAQDKQQLVPQYVSSTATDLLSPISSLGNVNAYIVGLQGTGCVQAAKAIHQLNPHALVISEQTCAAFQNDPQTAGAMAGWYILNIFKFTNSADAKSDADVATYMSEFPQYGTKNDTDLPWTSTTWGLMLTVQKYLSSLGAGDLTSSKLLQEIPKFTGPVIMGPSTLKCPGAAPYTNICADTVFGYQISQAGQLGILAKNNGEIPVGS